ncbi:MAG: NAD(P)/FAD-dependent oxidoreductase [Bosea sp. (in: a-proteobacteria)]|uniref:NAD(P)/FAD-dependent oxidoreductase n=1 Tax=Bosea sp. (in: a-proteobacteria) TaxID=1871050 RepID=UPI003F7C5207
MPQDLLAPDFSEEPYWIVDLPPYETPKTKGPRSVDVAVVGGGFAGLSAALTLARAGKQVAIFEARTIGAGAAARAAGSLGHVPKASLADLSERYGDQAAQAIYREARMAREYVEGLIRDFQIACNLRSGWRFVAAHSERAFERQRTALPTLRETWGDVELVERKDQRSVIGSDAFFGGVKIPQSATLQPALLQRGLAGAALNAGAELFQNTPITAIERKGDRYILSTSDGLIEARDVVLATNAETNVDNASIRKLRECLIVVPAFALATEEVSPETMARVLPIFGPVSDTYKIINYIAPNENGRRFILSGRAGRSDGDLRSKARRMFGYFRDRFPDLADVRVSNCWTGRFAVTADWVPHVGVAEGIHYVLGCCGTGIPMSTYLGHKAAEMIIDRTRGLTVFDRPLPALPFMGLGAPLLPLAVRGYELRDRYFR